MAAAMLTATAIDGLPDLRLLRLLQLVSPQLPVGAFAYSQGMEWAVENGWVNSADTAAGWIGGLLCRSLACFDIPLLDRLYRTWQTRDHGRFAYWNRYLLAGRGTAELQQEERSMGRALLRLLPHLQPDWIDNASACQPGFTAMFAAAACNWDIPRQAACAGLLWAWSENQVAAAVKLVPLGQTDAQRILTGLAEKIPGAVAQGLALGDEAIGASAPGLMLASALHETQYTRLFRS